MSTTHPIAILIEHDLSASEFLTESLTGAGFGVIEAADGEDGLRIIEQDRSGIDVALAQATMPGIGGREISAVLAQYRPELPVLLMPEDLAGIYPRNPELLVAELRASMERAAELTRKLVRACETLPHILTETRRLRAESADLLAAARAIRARRTLPACPLCASSRVSSILYGSDRMNRRDDLAAGRVVLGSAVRAVGAPAWHCRDCEHRWPA